MGHTKIVDRLLDAGAAVNATDSNGWTSLFWASISCHLPIVSVLLANGADKTLVSKSGHSLSVIASRNFMLHASPEISKISELVCLTRDVKGEADEMIERRLSFDGVSEEEEFDLTARDTSEESETFVWETPLPHQFLVVDLLQVETVIDVAVNQFLYPPLSRRKSWIDLWQKHEIEWDPSMSSSLVFLATRYAHYYHSEHCVDLLLSNYIYKVREFVEKHNLSTLGIIHAVHSFYVLIHFLRSDPGLFASTLHHQASLSDNIADVLSMLAQSMTNNLQGLIEDSLLRHDPTISGEGLSNKGIRAAMKRTMESYYGGSKTPMDLTRVLTEWLETMGLLAIPRHIVNWIWKGVFKWMSHRICNTMIKSSAAANSVYLCSKKGIHIRLNLTVLEDWVRSHTQYYRCPETVESLLQSLAPIRTLCLFVQVISGIRTIEEFLQILSQFQLLEDDHENVAKKLTMMQIQRVLLCYKTEGQESRISEEVLAYVQMVSAGLQDRNEHEYMQTVTLGLLDKNSSDQTGKVELDTMNTPTTPQPPKTPAHLILQFSEDLSELLATTRNATQDDIEAALLKSGQRWKRVNQHRGSLSGNFLQPYIGAFVLPEIKM